MSAKTFRLSRRVEDYEHAYIEAESAEEALRLYNEGETDLDWKFDWGGDSKLIGVDEIVPARHINEPEYSKCYEVSEDGNSLIRVDEDEVKP
jgi:hypothetical protein